MGDDNDDVGSIDITPYGCADLVYVRPRCEVIGLHVFTVVLFWFIEDPTR